MDQLAGLVSGLFTDTKATLYRAREEECRNATLALAAAAMALHALAMMLLGVPVVLALILAVFSFLEVFVPCWLGGAFTGGTGSAMDLLQLCGLVYLPLAIVNAVTGMLHLGLVAMVFGWIVMYWLVLIGHNFSSFDDVKFAYLAGIFVSFVLVGLRAVVLKGLLG